MLSGHEEIEMANENPAPRPPTTEPKSGRKPMPEQGVGSASATRFLHFKRFRFARVKGLFGIALIVLAVVFITVCVVVYLTTQ
jgi:hypothetical protein